MVHEVGLEGIGLDRDVTHVTVVVCRSIENAHTLQGGCEGSNSNGMVVTHWCMVYCLMLPLELRPFCKIPTGSKFFTSAREGPTYP